MNKYIFCSWSYHIIYIAVHTTALRWAEVFKHTQCIWEYFEMTFPHNPLSAFMCTYSAYCTLCHHKQLAPLLSTRQKQNEWQFSPCHCQVTQPKLHDTEPSGTLLLQSISVSPLPNRDHTLFIRASKMSQKRTSTLFSAQLTGTIVGLCRPPLSLLRGLWLFFSFLAFVILSY